MSDKPRRAWFQIHLSTAIVLMFIAGLIIRMNCIPDWAHMSQVYGWPNSFYEVHYGSPIETTFSFPTLLFDIGVAFGILILYAAYVEFVFHRATKNQKPELTNPKS